jgi:hypothetical protein
VETKKPDVPDTRVFAVKDEDSSLVAIDERQSALEKAIVEVSCVSVEELEAGLKKFKIEEDDNQVKV